MKNIGPILAGALIAAVLLPPAKPCCDAASHDVPASEEATHKPAGVAGNAGRLYVFREIKSFGADINDYVTVNGVPVYRLNPGSGFYCDVDPGIHLVGILHHKANALAVRIAPRQRQYICVLPRQSGGAGLRTGEITADQSFLVLLMQPEYAAERVRQYHLSPANCPR